MQTNAFARARGEGPLDITRLSGEQSNTSLIFGNRLILKLFRRLQPGINPDYEIGRQLTERIGYPRVPAVAGALEYRMTAEQPTTVAMLQQLVESQADGWRHATDEVSRFFEAVEGTAPPPVRCRTRSRMRSACLFQRRSHAMAGMPPLRKRSDAERRKCTSRSPATPATPRSAPEPFTAEDLASVRRSASAQARTAFDALKDAMKGARRGSPTTWPRARERCSTTSRR